MAPSKKTKTSTSSSGGGGKDKEPEFPLDKNRLVRVRSFKGRAYVDIREYYMKDGDMLPGKKGISLSPEQWKKLLSQADGINEALANV